MGWDWGGNHTRHWHGLPRGILGLGYGVKRADGKVVAADCIRVYVSRKRRVRDLSRKQRIPKKIDGWATDVVAVGHFRPHLGPGGSLSGARGTTGTLACVVQDDQSEYLLGSWHVLTNTTGKDGDPVFMPSLAVDGRAPVVGTLIATPIFHLNGGENAFDASVAKIAAGTQIDPSFAPGRPFGASHPASGSVAVLKRGASTQETRGTVDGISEDIPVMYNNKASDRAVLTGQITIVGAGGAFSAEGDSGAMVCTGDLGPIGLIACGSAVTPHSPLPHSVISPIRPILDFYELTIKVN